MKNRKKNKIKTVLLKIAVILIPISLIVIGSELVLQHRGRKPGFIPQYKLIPADHQLRFSRQFITDSEGVFKANLDYKWPEEIHINSDGFRSTEFKQYETKLTKILFVGDSFTWGSGDPITNSFVDIVSRRGYLVFNTGIPGTAPNQYAFLVEKYVPLLKPDIVAVMFYMGNDIVLPLPMLPNKNLWHVTDGDWWLYAFDEDGNYLSEQDAYRYYYAKIYGRPSTLQQIFMKSVIGTYSWAFFSRIWLKLRSHGIPEDIKSVDEYTRETLTRIKRVSEEHGAKFMLFLIPVEPSLLESKKFSIENNYHIFEGLDPSICNVLTASDYLPHGHFNNAGNQKYADFILKSIEKRNIGNDPNK